MRKNNVVRRAAVPLCCVTLVPLAGCAGGPNDFDAGKALEGAAGVALLAGYVALAVLGGKNCDANCHRNDCAEPYTGGQAELLGGCGRRGW